MSAKQNLYAVILAGGSGTRLWPLSRRSRPKQFIDLYSGGALLKQIVFHLSRAINRENIYIATGAISSKFIKHFAESLKIPLKNYFFEPEGKNSFAPVALLAARINQRDPEAVLAVIPCDNIISNQAGFVRTLKMAIQAAARGSIVTVGSKPTRPETGFGYIKVRRPEYQKTRIPEYAVERFIEKPDIARAKRFIRDKRFFWNAGMFIFRPEVFLNEASRIQPAALQIINRLCKMPFSGKKFIALWHKLPWISLDYAIMEKTRKIALVPAKFSWIDIGNWHSLFRKLKKTKNNNVLRGKVIALGCQDSLVLGQNRLVAVMDLNGIAVVDTPDALLVCPLEKSQAVKSLVEELKRQGQGQWL